ncbi:MAG: hypothetical protein QME76_12415 [Bacillota bacterium]|nr:hypothetical protein [Bacillota bacterium]
MRVYIGYVRDPERWTRDELVHVFTGRIDAVRPRFGQSMTVTISGRDLSAPLIDTEYSVAYARRTSSQVASLLAGKYGLRPRISTTNVVVPRDLFADRPEWDILQTLADLEGFVCYVDKDGALYFGPRPAEDEAVIATLAYRRPELAGAIRLREVEIDDSQAGVVNKVTVRHWLGDHKRLIEASVQDDKLIAAMGGRVRERVVYESKATTVDLARKIAARRLKELSRLVVIASGSCPGVPHLAAERKAALVGCGRFDGHYYIERVTHSYSKSGYTTEVALSTVRPDNAEQYRQDLYDYKERKM